MKPIYRIFGLLIPLCALVLLVLQVVFSNKLATLGKELGTIEYEIGTETDIHEMLSAEVASASSLLVLRDRALELGFAEPTGKQILHLTPVAAVAFDPGSVARNGVE